MKKKSLLNSLPAIAKMLGDKMKVNVRIGGNRAYTDGEVITIPSLPDGPDALLLARGYIDHEAAHVRFTDFDMKHSSPLEATLANIFEDVRIELKMGEVFPGCKRNLTDLASHLAAEGAFSLPESGEVSAIDAFTAWLVAALRLSVLGQDALQSAADDSMEALEEIFSDDERDQLLDLAIEGSFAASTQDAIYAARSIVKLLEEWEEQRQQAESQQQDQDNEQEEDESDDQGSDDPAQQHSGQDQDQQGGTSQSQSGQGSQDEDGQEKGQGNGQDTSQDEGSDQSHCADQGADQGTGAGKGKADAIRHILTATADDVVKSDMSAKIAKALDQHADDHGTEDLIVPSEKRTTPGTMDVSEVRRETAQLRGRLAGFIQSSRYQSSFPQKSGRRIVAGSLSRLAKKDSRVFRHETEKSAVNTAVAILLDRSGSMGGESIVMARQACLAAALALDTIPGVKVTTAAFPSSDYSYDSIDVMTPFGQSVRATARYYDIGATGGTPTTEALNWAGVALANRPEPRKICLVITDGDPNCPHTTVEAVGRLRATGIEVVGIGIGHDHIVLTIPNSRAISSVRELPSALFGVLQQELIK